MLDLIIILYFLRVYLAKILWRASEAVVFRFHTAYVMLLLIRPLERSTTLLRGTSAASS
jgi:hypothetical protein